MKQNTKRKGFPYFREDIEDIVTELVHHAMKAYSGVEVTFHSLLTSALNVAEWLAPC
jgi:hypothetical protein